MNVVAAHLASEMLDLCDHVIWRAPEESILCDLLGWDFFAGFDAREEGFLLFFFGGFFPMLHQTRDIAGQDVLLDGTPIGPDPGEAPKDPIRLALLPGASLAIDLEAGFGFRDRLHRAAEPGISQPGRTIDGRVGHPRDPDGWMGRLHGSRVYGQLRKFPETPTPGGLLPGPDQLEDLQGLFHAGPALMKFRAVDLVFEGPPAEAHPQEDPPAGELVDRRHLLGHAHRVVDGELEDPGPDAQAAGAGGDRGQQGQRIAGVARHEMMMSDRRRLEARLFGHAGELEALAIGIWIRGISKRGQGEGKTHGWTVQTGQRSRYPRRDPFSCSHLDSCAHQRGPEA